MAKKAKKPKKKKPKKKKAYSQANNRTAKGQFPKGVSGNPGGRPVNRWRDELETSIRLVEKRKRKKLMVHAVEQAYENDIVLVAILKKLLPDLKIEEIGLNAGEDLKSFITWLTGRNGDNPRN